MYQVTSRGQRLRTRASLGSSGFPVSKYRKSSSVPFIGVRSSRRHFASQNEYKMHKENQRDSERESKDSKGSPQIQRYVTNIRTGTVLSEHFPWHSVTNLQMCAPGISISALITWRNGRGPSEILALLTHLSEDHEQITRATNWWHLAAHGTSLPRSGSHCGPLVILLAKTNERHIIGRICPNQITYLKHILCLHEMNTSKCHFLSLLSWYVIVDWCIDISCFIL